MRFRTYRVTLVSRIMSHLCTIDVSARTPIIAKRLAEGIAAMIEEVNYGTDVWEATDADIAPRDRYIVNAYDGPGWFPG